MITLKQAFKFILVNIKNTEVTIVSNRCVIMWALTTFMHYFNLTNQNNTGGRFNSHICWAAWLLCYSLLWDLCIFVSRWNSKDRLESKHYICQAKPKSVMKIVKDTKPSTSKPQASAVIKISPSETSQELYSNNIIAK